MALGTWGSAGGTAGPDGLRGLCQAQQCPVSLTGGRLSSPEHPWYLCAAAAASSPAGRTSGGFPAWEALQGALPGAPSQHPEGKPPLENNQITTPQNPLSVRKEKPFHGGGGVGGAI